MDLFAAIEIINEFARPASVVIKHNNPCGIAEHRVLAKAIERSIGSDALSAFGGIVIVNRPLGKKEAQIILDRLGFFEIVIAPRFMPAALKVLKTRKNLRIIETGNLDRIAANEKFMYKHLDGGLLVQEKDPVINTTLAELKKRIKVASKRKPTAKDISELLFAWRCAKMVKSNAIVISRSHATVGIGAGQMSRVDAMHIACRKAGERSIGGYVASDGFFPKADNIDVAAAAGIKAIIQPGGSIRDREVMDAVNRHNLIMILTGERHFRH
jgi:phosphoribosylaminoimidazolecarboxamide formyltransferase/IMP cyclohydrolase